MQILHRKSTNVFKPWKPVLAVLTVDNYLHIFDLPANKTFTSSAANDEVFDSLVALPDSVHKAAGQPLSPRTVVFPDKDSNKKMLSTYMFLSTDP